MADDKKTVVLDVDGYEVLTKAIMALVNEYPRLSGTEVIEFATLSETRGIGLFPMSGAVIESQSRDILGYVSQNCVYPFTIYRRSGSADAARRISIKEWLDDLGRWLEGQTISDGSESYTLESYPVLTGTRRIRSIARTAPAYLAGTDESGTEDWAVSIAVHYTNEFEGGL